MFGFARNIQTNTAGPERNQEVHQLKDFTNTIRASSKRRGPYCVCWHSRHYGDFVPPEAHLLSCDQPGTEIPSVTGAISSFAAATHLLPVFGWKQAGICWFGSSGAVCPGRGRLSAAWKWNIFPAGVQEFHRAHPLERSGGLASVRQTGATASNGVDQAGGSEASGPSRAPRAAPR